MGTPAFPSHPRSLEVEEPLASLVRVPNVPPDWQAGKPRCFRRGSGGVIHKSRAAVIAAASRAVGGLCPRPPALFPWPCPPSPCPRHPPPLTHWAPREPSTGTSGDSRTSRPDMEVPGPPVSGKPGETSVKWQLCYDMTAKMWWMVSRGSVPPQRGGQGAGTP